MAMFHCHVSFRGCIVGGIFVAIPVPLRQEGSLNQVMLMYAAWMACTAQIYDCMTDPQILCGNL